MINAADSAARAAQATALLQSARAQPNQATKNLAEVRQLLAQMAPQDQARVTSDLMETEKAVRAGPQISSQPPPNNAQAALMGTVGRGFQMGEPLGFNEQLQVQGRSMKAWMAQNPDQAKKMESLFDRAELWDQLGPGLITGSAIANNPVGRGALKLWNDFKDRHHDSAIAELKPLVEQGLKAVRQDISKAGGDPSRVTEDDLLRFIHSRLSDANEGR